MDEDVKEGKGTVSRGVLDGVLQVRSQGVDEGEEGVSVLSVAESSKPVVDKVSVGARGIR